MSKRISAIVAVILFAAALSFVGAGAPTEQSKTPAMRIGTFDSRAVALAYWRSDQGMKGINAGFEEVKKAKAANDEKRIKELEIEMPGGQVRMHQQIFSTGAVTDIIETIKTSIPAIAQEAGVSLVVSKWEIAYKDPSIECVDVTPQLVKLFNPSAETQKMIEEMGNKEPVPIDQLSMDPRM
ncbi:MAG: hypothetical protein NTW86_17925 [Candidatus Sumerlaeota bacterium]|nr:hypothetical protein [Candidatus Sumerlaeota bacterium]